VADNGRPLPDLSHRHRSHRISPPERFSLYVQQRQDFVVDPHQDMAASLSDMGDAGRCTVTTVPQQHIAGSYRDTPEGLTSVGISDLEEIALQILQVDAEVDPPVGAETAMSADDRGVDRADAVTVGQRRSRMTLPKLIGHPAQPLLGGSEPLEQCHGRDVAPTGLLDVGHCFLKRTGTSQMDQQGSQQDGSIGEAAGATQRTQEARLLLPVRWQELTHQLPVIEFGNACIGFHPQRI
jgi:hypothetical protein